MMPQLSQQYKLVYKIVEGEHIWEFEQFEQYRHFRQYGMTAQKWSERLLVEESSVFDICVAYEDIIELKYILQRNQVTPVALYEVVSDWLVSKY